MKSYSEEKKYIGHRDQLIMAKRVSLLEGKGSGCELIEVQNGSGLHFSVNMSRGMDIPYVEFNGQNFGFVSPCGIVAPQYFDDKGLGFLKSFTAGFLTTCGLKMAGAPCEYEGNEYGLHGNVSHTPAEESGYRIDEKKDIPTVNIYGKMRDAVVFGDKLLLEREIRCDYKDRKIYITDQVTNEGYKPARHMIIYHCNIGYPILSPESEIFIPSEKVYARNEHAQEGIAEWDQLQEPDASFEEMCYYHIPAKDRDGYGVGAIFNHQLNMGIAVYYHTDTLDRMVQWKMMGAGDYVMGLEPCNSTIDGIKDAVENGTMKYIQPGETIEHRLVFEILNKKEEFDELKKKY